MKTRKINFLFYLIPLFFTIYLILRWRFTPTASPDTYSYIDLAQVLPSISEAKDKSLFPIGYPIFLKILNLVFNKYAVSYKIGTFLCLMFSLTFVKIKRFYWQEIWTLFTFYTFLSIIPWGWSETLMIPLLIMVFYYNHQFLNNKINDKKFVFLYPILLFICVLVKYSSIFFIIAHFIFVIFLKLSKDKKYWQYLKITIISLVLSVLYLLYNKITTGFAMGKRITPTEEHIEILNSVNNILSSFTPYPFLFPKTPQWQLSLDWIFSPILGGILAVFFVRIIYNYFPKNYLKYSNLLKQNNKNLSILIFNILNATVFLLGTFYSYFTTKIDTLGPRLLLGFYLFFFFTVIISLPNFKNKNIVLFIISLFCLCLNITSLIIDKFSVIKTIISNFY